MTVSVSHSVQPNLSRPIRWASPNAADLSRWVHTNLEATEDNVVLSKHVTEERLSQRGFSRADVVDIIRKGYAYRAEQGSFPGEFKVNFSKSMGDRDAAVACLVNPKTSKITVVTVMWVDRTYLKP